MDLTILFTIIGAVVTAIAFVYAFLRNLKSDMHHLIERVAKENQALFERAAKENQALFERAAKENQVQFDRIDKKMEKFDEKLTDIDRRLCRLEGAFSSKDCCILKEEKHIKQAE